MPSALARRAKSRGCKRSARKPGSMSTLRISSALHRPLSEFDRVLRRCENACATTRSNTVRLSMTKSGVRGFRRTIAESTFGGGLNRSEEHTSELQSLMRISYAVFCLKKKKNEQTKKLKTQ